MKQLFLVFLLAFLIACQFQNEKEAESSESFRPPNQDSLALDSINLLLRADINNLQLYFKRAKIYKNLGNINGFEEDLKRVIKINPDFALAYYEKALYHKEKNQFDDFKRAIEECIAKEDTFSLCLLEGAWISLVLKEYDKMFISINKVLKQNPYNATAYYYKGLAYTDLQKRALAISSLQTAVENDNEFIKAYLLLANIYYAEKDSLALAYYDNAIRIDTLNLEAYYGKAMFYQETKRYSKAIEIYEYINTLGDYREPYFNMGYIYLQYLNATNKSIDFFSKAIEKDSLYLEAYLQQGHAYRKLKLFDKAKQAYKKALKIHPSNTEAAKSFGKMKRLAYAR